MRASFRRHHRLWIGLATLLVVGIAAGLAWFQPWKLFIDHRVDDALPAVATASAPAPSTPVRSTPRPPTPTATSTAHGTPSPVPARPTLLSRGSFISHEHDTSGTVSVVRQPDGTRVLAISDLDTSDGPDVHVWLTDQPVRPGEDNWYVFDDGEHISLGTLKGNLGNLLYRIPADADLRRLTSVSLWCDRFDVSFGAAELMPV